MEDERMYTIPGLFNGAPAAGGCTIRVRANKVTRYHDRAPRGQSYCDQCGRTVCRMGRWWV
jgi:hypothetical protein